MEFTYRARNKAGEIEEDTVSATDRPALLADLRARGLLPIFLSEKKSIASPIISIASLLRTISLEEKLAFVKNLSVMIRAGVPVPRALKILSLQTTNKRFKEIIMDLAHNVESGLALSQSLAKHPDIFSSVYVTLVEVGEASGNLDANLDYLVTLLRREHDLVRKTKGALTYPVVVFATLILVGILMFIFVLPKLTATFKELNVKLPPLTRLLIAVVDLFSQHAIISCTAVVVIAVLLVTSARTQAGRRFFQKVALNFPVISGITKKINLARFTLTLGMLLKSGMQIVPALTICARGLGNIFYAEALSEVAAKVRSGVNISVALEKTPHLFSPLLTQMIKVGEESGSVEEILKDMGEYYDEEVDQVMKNLSSIIEPLMVVVIGAVVAVMALALIMPIYSITQAV